MWYIFAAPIIIALAIVAALISGQFRRRQQQADGQRQAPMFGVYKLTFRGISIALIAILVIATAARSINKAESGEAAIIYNFGAITNQRDEGLFLAWPWQDVKTLNLRTQTYTNAIQGDDGQFSAGGIGAFTAEGQDVFLRLTINYVVQASNVQRLVREHGINYYERVRVEARILQTVKEITPEYATIKLKDSRQEIADKIKARLTQQLAPLYLDVTSVAIDNVFFSDDYQAAINRKAIVEQEALAAINQQEVAKAQAESARQVARGEADAVVIRAQGEATARVTTAEAEAKANQLVAASLTSGLVDYVRAQALAKANTIYVPIDANLFITPPATAGR